jgi:hypothetical protein
MSTDAATVQAFGAAIPPKLVRQAVAGLTPQGDLAPVPSPDRLGWRPGSAEESLAVLFARASDTAHCAIKWYLKAKRPKQANARAVRGGSIFLAALAGIVPMLSQMPGSSIAPSGHRSPWPSRGHSSC